MHSYFLGIFLIALGSAFFAASGLFVQFTDGAASSWVALFGVMLAGGVIVIPFALVRLGWRRAASPEHRWLLFLRGFVSVAQVGALFYALHSIPLTDAMLFRQTAPLWLPLLSALFLGEPMPLKFWPVIIVGFIGVGLVYHPHFSALSIGYYVAALNGILFAFQNMLTRKLNTLGEPQERILLYLYVVAILASFGPAWGSFTPIGPEILIWLILAGLFALSSTGCLVFAYGLAPAWLLAPIGNTAVVFAALLDWLVFDKTPDLIVAVGMTLVIASGILIVLLSAQRKS